MKMNKMTIGVFFILAASLANGKNCAKMTVRKEMNDLTESEWNIYLDTIAKAAKNIDPETKFTVWETGMLKHKELGPQIHGKPMFGYAHRYFLRWFEEKLQKINPNFAFFYWDAGKEFDQWRDSKIWDYLGEKDGEVSIDGFKGTRFNASSGYLVRKCDLGRNPPPTEYYGEIWNKTKEAGYGSYCTQLEYAHGVLHNLVGGKQGQMGTLHYSPIDPIFYAHHANVDYTLLQAQLLWSQNKYAMEKSFTPLTLDSKIPGFPEVSIKDVLDVSDICVSYKPSSKGRDEPTEPTNSDKNPSVTNTTNSTNSTIDNGTNSTMGTNTTINSTESIGNNATRIKNFTIELPPEWVEMSFKNNSKQVLDDAKNIKNTVNEKVDKGEAFVHIIVADDKAREYVGAKVDGEKNLKRLNDSSAKSVQVGLAGIMIIFAMLF